MRVHLKVTGPKKPSRGTIRKDADLLAGNLRWSYGDEGANPQSNIVAIDINAVRSRMLQVRGQQVLLASLIGDNLSTDSTKTTIELNLAVLKITHEVTRSKKEVR